MAERLGTGLQNLLQRFDSAWHLQSPLAQGGLFFYWIVIHIYKSVSGGSHPGCMHVKKAGDGFEVFQFDAVGDGSDFTPTAKAIFGWPAVSIK